jgi:enamine deaminase RidA (YjgF/YER057c/UK114 family)
MPEYLEKTEFQAARAYSPAVITQGGRIAWLAGQTATRDQAGNDISGQFEAQVRTIFGLIDQTLKRCGGSLANLVTMTVFINDPRHGDAFVELRKAYFPDDHRAVDNCQRSSFLFPGEHDTLPLLHQDR